jgi:dienelactone hydrolase
MKTSFKLGAWGFVVGSVVTMIVGFSWGGWSTGGTADRIAMERSTAAVTAALVPVCLEKSKADPASSKKLVALKALTSTYDQRDAVLNDGWATVGVTEANRDVAEACASQLLKVAATK